MPAPGDQYNGGNVKNPFEERVVNGFTAREIATLQSRLNKQLGPEYISQRPGNGGGRVAYLEGNKAIALANEVFGFNGWSSSLGQVQIDYVDEHQGGKISLGLSIVVRITLKDGTYHEDVGYGSIENGKNKAMSFEKAKKEAATDGLKRALRTFGNVLGNCLYDKEYLKKVQAMKVKPIKFEEVNLYRHPDFALPAQGGPGLVKPEPQMTPIRPNQVLRTRTEHLGESFSADFDDEFDGNLFDGVELNESTRNEQSFETLSAPDAAAPKSIEGARPVAASSGRTSPIRNSAPRQPNQRAQPAPTGRGQGGNQQQQNQANVRPMQNGPNQRQPQTPLQPAMQRPNAQQQQETKQSANVQQAHDQARPLPQAPNTNAAANQQPPNGRPPVGFVTSRAAELLQATDTPATLSHLPAFNPHAESPIPKDQRTPGIDHARSVPIKRDTIGAPPAPQPPAQQASRPGSVGPPAAGFGRPTNFVNPHHDANRRIGMPGAPNYAMSPSANRGAYKPPTFASGAQHNGVKRERPVLQDVSNTGVSVEGPDVKKQRVDALGAENAGPVST